MSGKRKQKQTPKKDEVTKGGKFRNFDTNVLENAMGIRFEKSEGKRNCRKRCSRD
jgi:hypothetical protein